MYNQVWYNSLTKPLFTPPSIVFTVAWSFLYLTIFISLLVYASTPSENKRSGYLFFVAQLLFNFLWSPVFFGLKNILSALVVILLIDIFTILTIRKFFTVSKLSAVLLFPYMLWLIFATYLNFAFLILN